MQLHDRFSSANRPPPNTTISIVRLALFGLVTVPLLLVGYFVSEFRTLAEGWTWRNAVATKAVITSHEVASYNRENEFLLPGSPPDYESHAFTYTYTSGDWGYSGELTVPSKSKTTIDLGTKNFAPSVGEKFSVYFQPHDPTQHKLFFDPRPPFWQSARRIGVGAGLGLGLIVMIGLIVVFYKPNRRGNSRLPERLDLA